MSPKENQIYRARKQARFDFYTASILVLLSLAGFAYAYADGYGALWGIAFLIGATTFIAVPIGALLAFRRNRRQLNREEHPLEVRLGQIVILLAMCTTVFGLFVVPAMFPVARSTGPARVIETKSNGKNMYIAVFADAVDFNEVGFPRTRDYSNSTDYILTLAGQRQPDSGSTPTRVLPAGADFFHVYKPAINWSSFGPANNGWCVVADGDDTSSHYVPFLISSNLLPRYTNLSMLIGPVGATIDKSSKLGKKGDHVIVIFHGGGSIILKASDRWEDHLPKPCPSMPILHP